MQKSERKKNETENIYLFFGKSWSRNIPTLGKKVVQSIT